MIEYLGLIYAVAKDLKGYLSWQEESKLVDFNWPETSGLKAEAQKSGLELSWSNPEKVQSRILEGYEIVYEIDKSKQIRRRLELKDGLVLMGKRSPPGV
ncbi:MAG: hypothetical protein ACE5HC_15035 [Candidatus Binatia bacterium]